MSNNCKPKQLLYQVSFPSSLLLYKKADTCLISVAFSEGKAYSKAKTKANMTKAKKAWFSPAS